MKVFISNRKVVKAVDCMLKYLFNKSTSSSVDCAKLALRAMECLDRKIRYFTLTNKQCLILRSMIGIIALEIMDEPSSL